MRRAGRMVMGCVLACGASFGQAGQAGPETVASLQALRALRDRGRVLLVFAPDAKDPRYGTQLAWFERERAAMQDRDLVLMTVVGSAGRDGAGRDGAGRDGAELRQRFGAQLDQFTVILVGKDGGEKLREHEALAPAKLEETIDAMPMRRDEVKRRRAAERLD